MRQKGKISELACGYGGSVGALTAMSAIDMGLTETELKPLVDAWRDANPNIVQLWYNIEEAALTAIRTRTPAKHRGLTFTVESDVMFIALPSGRRLAYMQPRIGENQWGNPSINYWGVGVNQKWQVLETYGGKLVENIVGAFARNLLTRALHTLDKAGNSIVMHVHDEAVIDDRGFERLRTQYAGKPVPEIRPAIQQLFRSNGGSISDPELSSYAELISQGKTVRVKVK